MGQDHSETRGREMSSLLLCPPTLSVFGSKKLRELLHKANDECSLVIAQAFECIRNCCALVIDVPRSPPQERIHRAVQRIAELLKPV